MLNDTMYKCISGSIAGAVFFYFAAFVASNTEDFLQSSVIASGRVIELEHGPNHPAIAFVTQSGEHVSFIEGGFLPTLRLNEQVAVRYLPSSPVTTARLDSFGSIWGNALLLLGFGLAAFIGSTFEYFRLKSLKNRA